MGLIWAVLPGNTMLVGVAYKIVLGRVAMEQLDLKGFEDFIAERDLEPEAHRSFYVHWVRRF